MAKGRKRTPSKILELRGGTEHTHRPPRTGEPDPPVKIPRCPSHLDDIAKKEFRRVGKLLADVGIISELDMANLAAYAAAYSKWVQYSLEGEELRQRGIKNVIWDSNKNRFIYNPINRLWKEAYELMLKAGATMGLSCTSRAGLKVSDRNISKGDKFRQRKEK